MHDESHPVFFAYRLPKYKNIIPISTSAKSTALLLRFFSRNTIAPNRKETLPHNVRNRLADLRLCDILLLPAGF